MDTCEFRNHDIYIKKSTPQYAQPHGVFVKDYAPIPYHIRESVQPLPRTILANKAAQIVEIRAIARKKLDCPKVDRPCPGDPTTSGLGLCGGKTGVGGIQSLL